MTFGMGSPEEKDRASFLVTGKVFGSCHYCGAQATTWDHKTPRSKGGKGGHQNLVRACRRCNQRKGSMGYEEFKALLRKEGMDRT